MKIVYAKWVTDWWFVLEQFFHTIFVNERALISNTLYNKNKKLTYCLFILRAQLELKCNELIIRVVKSDFYLCAWHFFFFDSEIDTLEEIQIKKSSHMCYCIHVHLIRFLLMNFSHIDLGCTYLCSPYKGVSPRGTFVCWSERHWK